MTQSGGQSAGIQLQVGLDLAFFRSQLVGLQAVTAGTKLSFGVTFNRLDIQNELNTLATNIKKRNYFLEVKTNLSTEIKNAKDLATALDNLSKSQQAAKSTTGQRLGVGAIGRVPSQGGLEAKDVRKLYTASANAGLLVFDKGIAKTKASMVAAMEGVGIDAVEGLLNGLKSQDERLRSAAEYLGESLIKATKNSLGIKSPSKEFEEIGKNVGKGFENGALSSMDDAFDALESKMRQRGKILDTVARGIFRMLGMDSAAMLQQAREQRAKPVRTPIAGLLPAYTPRGTREETVRQLAEGGPSVAQGPGMLALSNEALGRRVSSILQEYFKVAEVQVRESFNPQELKQSLNVFSYMAQSLRDAESRTKQARVAESVDSLMQSIDNAIKIAQARVRVSRVQVSELGPMAQTALPAGRVAGLLPGRPSQASVLELNNILAGAIREYFAAVAREIKPGTGSQGRPLLGPGSTVAGLLPSAGGTTPRGAVRFNTVTTGGTYGPAEPPQFTAPSLPPQSGSPGYLGGRTGSSVRTRTPGGFIGGGIPSGGGPEATAFVNASRNALAYSQALSRLRESLRGVQAGQLPLVGSIKELAGEFGQATKQVLLYGTAYKGLAFLTSLPGEAFDAAKALGTYKNQLQAVTTETGTFSSSLAFVDGLAQRFNVPLESARQGFVKLYASMQPAGFNQEQIEGLFTGISQSAAAFGLSADKVDRVNYAFAQMASKGQIMSEELKGQLGDVLPGALALFAEAAKMSIPEFSKAMEDGRFKGDAMVQVLENVGILMKVKFGAAAQGAAKTLQGALNGIQNNLKLMYEALGPVVNRMAAVFGPSVTSLIKSATDTIKAFGLGISTTGDSFAAMSPQAQGFYSSIQNILPSIKSLVPSFVAAAQNIGYFATSLATASQPLLGLLKLALDFISIPLVARVGVYATVIGALTSAFTLLKNTGIIQATIAMIRFIATLTVGQVQAWIASIQAAIAALVAMVRTANIARLGLMALKVTLVSFGVGAVLLGLDFVAQRLLNIGAAADNAKKRAAALTDELARAVETGNVALASAKYVEEETKAQSLGKSKQLLERFQGGFQQGASMTKQEYEQLQRAGLATGINFNERKGRATATSGQVAENLKTARAGYVEALNASGSAREALRDSMQVSGNMQRQLDASRSQMKDIPPSAAGGESTDETKEASRINQLLQENLRLSNEKGIIGKDELTQLELKVKLAQAIFVLEEDQIKSSMKGREQQIALNNATLAYQVIVGKADDDWAEATQKIEDIGLQVTEITDKILGQQTPEQSPLQKALSDLKKEAIDNVQVLEKLRKSIRALAGDRPEGKTAIAGIEQAFSLINTQDPLLAASKRVASDMVKDLKSELKELNTSGLSLSTLDKVILKLGDDWKSLSPQIKSDLTELAGQIDAAKPFAEIASALRRSREELTKMTSTSTLVISSANSIGDAFGTAFKGVITGSMSAREALAGFFQSLADSFADMVAKMIAEYLKMQLIQGIMSLIPGLGSFGGGAAVGQAVSMPTGVGIGAGGGILQNSGAQGFGTLGPNFGIRQFANGGIVTGPTLGLVGEGRYNEAVIPLPDGKSVPVDLGGAMGNQITSNIVVNVSSDGKTSSSGAGSDSAGLGRKIEGAVKQVIVGELRPGGLLAGRR
jgi:tape measure domain-containing protein